MKRPATTTAVAAVGLAVFVCACDHERDPNRLLGDADRLALLFNWPRAATRFHQAESLFRQSGDQSKALVARLGYLWVTADMGASAAANEEIDRALGDAARHSNSRLMLRCLIAKAARQRVVSEASARTSWEKILSLATEVGEKRWQARAQAEIGEIKYLDGDVETAIRMVKQALLAEYSHLDMGAAIYYTALVGNGMVEAGQAEKGLRYCGAAMRLASVVKDAGFPFQAYQGKARSLIALHRRAEANAVLEEGLRQARNEKNRAAEAQLLIVAGTGETEHRRAIKYLSTANWLSDSAGFHHSSAWSAMELAKAYIEAGDLRAAELSATKGLEAMPDLQDRYHLPQHLALLAELKAKSGKPDEANSLYERAGDVIDAVLVTAPSRQIVASLIATLSSVYVGHFELAAARMHDTAKAYEVIEQARGRSLADSLRDEKRMKSVSDPVSASAQKQINVIQLALLREPSRANRQELLDKLFEAEQIFTPVRETSSPLLSAAVMHSRFAPLPEFQSRLHSDEVVLEYVLGEPRSYCLRITHAAANITVLAEGRQSIERVVDAYLTEIRDRHPAIESGRRLYSMLLEPVLRRGDNSRLVVIPDGNLNFLPFDTLVDSQGRRVIESHIVSYCPSGTVLYRMRSSEPRTSKGLRFLGIGDVQYTDASAPSGLKDFLGADTKEQFLNIPSTRNEVIAASHALGTSSTLLLGQEATEGAFKAQPLETFATIHIAAHGVASAEFPDRAALVLATDKLGREDGLLQAREIRSLPLRAELVTLSACDTGFGSVDGQEGVANLVRAFLFGGAKSVVASLWTASDVYTAHLMRRFYDYLGRGGDRGVALRQAKLDSIKEFEENAVPYYWACFVMVGEGFGCVRCPEPSARSPLPRSSR